MPWVHVAVDVPHAQLKVEVAERIVANWIGSGGGVGDLRDFLRRRLVVRRPRSTPLQPPVQEFPAWDFCKTVMWQDEALFWEFDV